MFSITKTIKNGKSLLICEATRDDAKAVLNFVNSVCAETDFLTFGVGEFTMTEQEEKDYLENCLKTENCLYLLAILDGVIVGSLSFNAGKRPRLKHVGEFGISVQKAYWRLGIGSLLIDSLISWAKKGAIIKKINLKVRTDNKRAIALYKQKGFVIEGTLTREIFLDGVFYDDFWMGLTL